MDLGRSGYDSLIQSFVYWCDMQLAICSVSAEANVCRYKLCPSTFSRAMSHSLKRAEEVGVAAREV